MDQPITNLIKWQGDDVDLANQTPAQLEELLDSITATSASTFERWSLALISDATWGRLRPRYDTLMQQVDAWREYRAWEAQQTETLVAA